MPYYSRGCRRCCSLIQILAFVFCATVALGQQANLPSRDAGALTFDDFPWEEPTDLRPLEGAVPVGEPVDIDAAIMRYERRVNTHPEDYASQTVLGSLLLRRATEEDDLPSYSLSEAQLRNALKVNPNYKPAKLALASTLMAQHGFKESLALFSELNDDSPGRPANLAGLFDCHLELGEYTEAEGYLVELWRIEISAPVLARAARLDELKGNLAEAISKIDLAIENLLQTTAAPPESLAWYCWRKGSLHIAAGDSEGAAAAFESVLASDPSDEAALVGLAMTHFLRNELPQTIELLERAAQGEAPPVVALLGDALALDKQIERAEPLWDRTAELMREEAKDAKVAHAREVALFYADHNRNAQEALELSKLDLEQREDGFAFDCQAWILFKKGDFGQAKIASDRAIAAIPHDLNAQFHAALIYEKLGDLDTARNLLRKIAKINPRFSITYFNEFIALQKRLGLST